MHTTCFLKFEKIHSSACRYDLNIAGRVANGIDSDQTRHSVASDQVYTVFTGMSVPIHRVITIILTILIHDYR